LQSAENTIDGGFKKNWKEFTLWKYNKKPVENYKNGDLSKIFSGDTSESGGNAGLNFVSELGEIPYATAELAPLTAQVISYVLVNDDNQIRKMTFRNLKNFTGKTDRAGIKAVIYPKSGTPYIEDWPKKKAAVSVWIRPMKIIDNVILIFSNPN
jgi:hypothetical protein